MDDNTTLQSLDYSRISDDIKTLGYRFVTLISERPSISLAEYEPNKYSVCILQRHRATLEQNGEANYWKLVDSDYCLRLLDRFGLPKYEYFVTNPVIQNAKAMLATIEGTEEVSTMDSGCREDFLRDATYHVLRAFHHLHVAGLAHLNFDWANVWLDVHNHCYLGGFEHLVPVGTPASALVLGFAAYRPPELLQATANLTVTPDMLRAADMWALGVNLFEVLTGEWVGSQRFPDNANEISRGVLLQNIRDNIAKIRYRLKAYGTGLYGISFIEALLKMDYNERLTAQQALNHPWIVQREKAQKPWSDSEPPVDGTPEDDELAADQMKFLAAADRLDATLKQNPNSISYAAAQLLLQNGYEFLQEVYRRPSSSTLILLAKNLFTEQKVAIKRKAAHMSSHLRGERFHWPTLSHPYVLQLIDLFQESAAAVGTAGRGRSANGNHFYFVTEWCPQGDVLSCLRKRRTEFGGGSFHSKEVFLQRVTAQALQAFHYLHHDLKLAHLNFSWQHVMLNEEGEARLGDFSYMRSMTGGQGHLRFGYLPLRAPETFVDPGPVRSDLDRVDMWALGASLLRTLAKKSIAGEGMRSRYDYKNSSRTYRQILDNLLALPNVLQHSKLDKDLQDFLLKLLRFTPEVRLTAAEALAHAWIVKADMQSGDGAKTDTNYPGQTADASLAKSQQPAPAANGAGEAAAEGPGQVPENKSVGETPDEPQKGQN